MSTHCGVLTIELVIADLRPAGMDFQVPLPAQKSMKRWSRDLDGRSTTRPLSIWSAPRCVRLEPSRF
jgi:hypothetical protein